MDGRSEGWHIDDTPPPPAFYPTRPGANPINSLQACEIKSFLKSLVVASLVKLNQLMLVLTFKYKVLLLTSISKFNLATSVS